jgi:hypothetical protein
MPCITKQKNPTKTNQNVIEDIIKTRALKDFLCKSTGVSSPYVPGRFGYDK